MAKMDQEGHWLVRRRTIKLLWWVFAVLLALTVVLQLASPIKGYFVVDGWLGFGAVFGFLSCLVMVLAAKGLGYLLKRREDYYDDREDPDDA